MLRSLTCGLFLLVLAPAVQAQIPTKCFEIESILVDACNGNCPGGGEEWNNEMVRFTVGPAPLSISGFSVVWPTYLSTGGLQDPFLGFVQNATTATTTAAINASIEGCGHLLEPPGGIIPLGATVIAVTSTTMCPTGNSFAQLSDTLYIIYQQAGNITGHFANYGSSPMDRTLIMRYTPTACADTAVYDRSQLVDMSGGHSAQDGATVNFTWPGTPTVTYTNDGCQAPFIPLQPAIVSGGGPLACGASTALVGQLTGEAVTYFWEGGHGTFSDPNAFSTTYTPGPGDGGTFSLSFCAVSACGDTVCDQVSVTLDGTEVTIQGDATLCGSLATTVLTASGADSYEWSTGALTPSITVGVMQAGPYWVVGTSACGSDTAYITVTVMHQTLHYTNVSCHGAADGQLEIVAQGGAEPYTYSWSNGEETATISGLAPGTYTYTIADAEGCSSGGGFTITEPTPLVLSVGNDTTICAGGYAVLLAEGSGGSPAYTFTWSPEGPLVYPTTTTTYSVVITDQHGCTLPAQDMTVNVGGGAATFTSTDTEGCGPLCVTFTSGTPGSTYTWQFGDGQGGSGSTAEHCYTAEGSYDVSLTVAVDGADCPAFVSMTDLVQVLPAPVAAIVAVPTVGLAPLTVSFTDASTPSSATSSWDFGDQTASTDPDPTHVYTAPGTYMVVLESTTGCSDRDTLYIVVNDGLPTVDSSWVVVPNVISPNNDGRNDAFRVSSNGLTGLSVDIFNRWGQQVGDIRQVGMGWGGRTPSGNEVPEGTYFYVLKAEGIDGRHYDLHGAFTLVR